MTRPAAHSPLGRWRRWRKATGNDRDTRRQEPSERRGRREQPDARGEPGERQPWTRWEIEPGTTEERFRRTPTWHAKCRMLCSRRPLRFELWGACEDLPPTNPCPIASRESKLNDEQHGGHKIYTGSGHRCGVKPYSSVWCGGLPQGLMMNSTGKNCLARGVLELVR